MASPAEHPVPTAEDFVEFIRDRIKEEPLLCFHEDHLFARMPPRLLHPDTARVKQAASAAVQLVKQLCPALAIAVREDLYGLDLELSGSGEWVDAQQFAFGKNYHPDALSPAAESLLERIESGELSTFRSELSVRHRINCFGYSRIERVMAEVELKRGIRIKLEESGEGYPQKKRMLRFSVESRSPPASRPTGLNPILPAGFGTNATPGPLEFRRWLWQLLLQTKPTGKEEVHLWAISSRAEFFRCFPWCERARTLPSSEIIDLLESLRGHPALHFAWDFSHATPHWTAGVQPAVSWEAALVELAAELDRPTPEKEFGLTSAAAVLYDWLLRQPLEWGLTPVLEDEIDDRRLMLECPWEDENQRLWFQILCEEISNKTPLRVRAVAWKCYHSEKTRIHRSSYPPAPVPSAPACMR
jgi:hypothetical protein